MTRQGRIIRAAISSQQRENSENLQMRYAHYSRAPILKPIQYPGCTTSTGRFPAGVNDHLAKDHCYQMDHWPRCYHIHRTTQPRWRQMHSNISRYWRLLMEHLLVQLWRLTLTHTSLLGMLSTIMSCDDIYPQKPGRDDQKYMGPTGYTICNLTTGKEYLADVTHLWPSFYDPTFTTPPNVAARDTKEYVVKSILHHDFSDPDNKRWLVQWALDGDEYETWEVLKEEEFKGRSVSHLLRHKWYEHTIPEKAPGIRLNIPRPGPGRTNDGPHSLLLTSPMVDPSNGRHGNEATYRFPSTHNTLDQATTPKQRTGRPRKQITSSTTGTLKDA